MSSYSEALSVEMKEGPEAAVPLMEAVLAEDPGNLEATVWLLRWRLEQDDHQAEIQARSLMKKVVDPSFVSMSVWYELLGSPVHLLR